MYLNRKVLEPEGIQCLLALLCSQKLLLLLFLYSFNYK